MNLYTLQSIPYYNTIIQQYTNILILNKQPEGELLKITKRINQNKLSPFKTNSNICHAPNCLYAITKIDNRNELMCIDELPDLFEYLLNNNYEVDNQVTKIMQKSNVKTSGELICIIKYRK